MIRLINKFKEWTEYKGIKIGEIVIISISFTVLFAAIIFPILSLLL